MVEGVKALLEEMPIDKRVAIATDVGQGRKLSRRRRSAMPGTVRLFVPANRAE
jgi:hypothetical protein